MSQILESLPPAETRSITPLTEKLNAFWALTGLVEIVPLCAGGVIAGVVESFLMSASAIVAGVLGTALVIAVLMKKVPLPPPPVEATTSSRKQKD